MHPPSGLQTPNSQMLPMYASLLDYTEVLFETNYCYCCSQPVLFVCVSNEYCGYFLRLVITTHTSYQPGFLMHSFIFDTPQYQHCSPEIDFSIVGDVSFSLSEGHLSILTDGRFYFSIFYIHFFPLSERMTQSKINLLACPSTSMLCRETKARDIPWYYIYPVCTYCVATISYIYEPAYAIVLSLLRTWLV